LSRSLERNLPKFPILLATVIGWVVAQPIWADQVEMKNGDRYVGNVTSVTGESVVLQSEVLGQVKLPRSQVAIIALGTNAPAQVPRASNLLRSAPGNDPRLAVTNAGADLSTAFRNLGANTNFIQEIREQLLSAAGPEANKQFDTMVGDLMSGRMDMNALRAQARSAADQLRTYQRELRGQPGGEMIDEYLEVLDGFLKETAPPPATAPAAARRTPVPATPPAPVSNR